MDSGILDQYVLPDGAAEAIRRNGMQPSKLDDGVSFYVSEHDRGVSFRFLVHQERNPIKSKIAGYPVFDEIEMIEWKKDRFDSPTEQVRFLPEELLSFDPDGECVGGRYKESYLRFKQGLGATGTPLQRWGVLSDNDIATLTAMNIFTVEQFAAQPRSKIVGKFPQDMVDAFEQAIEWVKGKDTRASALQQTEQILSLSQENSQLKDMIDKLSQQVSSLMNMDEEAPRKRGRPKKETEDSEE